MHLSIISMTKPQIYIVLLHHSWIIYRPFHPFMHLEHSSFGDLNLLLYRKRESFCIARLPFEGRKEHMVFVVFGSWNSAALECGIRAIDDWEMYFFGNVWLWALHKDSGLSGMVVMLSSCINEHPYSESEPAEWCHSDCHTLKCLMHGLASSQQCWMCVKHIRLW